MRDRTRYIPAAAFAIGCLLLLSVQTQRSLQLRAPLDALIDPVSGMEREELTVPEDQIRVAGMTSYVNRVYRADSAEMLLYVGYYDSQQQGKSVHSPKNCLPGGGWEPVESSRLTLATPGGPAEVNRYVIGNKQQRALVYYWYQGRGRVAANEYAVKWHLMRDAALRRRTDEALVRIIVPISPRLSVDEADRLAQDAALRLIPSLDRHLPV